MNLDLMFLATELTGDQQYRNIAISQAEKSSKTHIRSDYTTNHVVNFDPRTGEKTAAYTHQGESDSPHIVGRRV
jgi:unsaturated chondroitin disaccharide hydrolase